MKSCFEGHKRRRIYHPHKSPIICVILFSFFPSFFILWCSATPGGYWRNSASRSARRLPTQAARKRGGRGGGGEEEEELQGRSVPVGEI